MGKSPIPKTDYVLYFITSILYRGIKRMSLSCLKNVAMISLSYFVMFGSMRADEECVEKDTRPWKASKGAKGWEAWRIRSALGFFQNGTLTRRDVQEPEPLRLRRSSMKLSRTSLRERGNHRLVVYQRKAWEKDQRYHTLSSESGIPKKRKGLSDWKR
ncbi:unnamed protein product [Dovyalis caffra]|uniref:Uncharacterized protein n=1 Tax=Dovyalis caffra TaxID=77055 RepID=A0AAV1R859_9ROSI|nr:unnamed protein product [Dovyalis caffra]